MSTVLGTITAEASAEVTKAAGIRQWRIRGVFDDDEITVEVGNVAVYLRTGDTDHGCPAMLPPETARELARVLNLAADKATPKEETL